MFKLNLIPPRPLQIGNVYHWQCGNRNSIAATLVGVQPMYIGQVFMYNLYLVQCGNSAKVHMLPYSCLVYPSNTVN